MTLSPAGYALIKRFEDFRPTAYHGSADPAWLWTIAWGHTNHVQEGDTCSYMEGLAYLENDVQTSVAAVNHLVEVPLKQSQFDACVSLVFNIGGAAFAKSDLLARLNARDYVGAAAAFLCWQRAGRDRHALLPRREAERALFSA